MISSIIRFLKNQSPQFDGSCKCTWYMCMYMYECVGILYVSIHYCRTTPEKLDRATKLNVLVTPYYMYGVCASMSSGIFCPKISICICWASSIEVLAYYPSMHLVKGRSAQTDTDFV